MPNQKDTEHSTVQQQLQTVYREQTARVSKPAASKSSDSLSLSTPKPKKPRKQVLPVSEEVKTKRQPVLIQWTRAKNRHLTDKLLSMISDSDKYRQIFGLKTIAGNVPTGGDTAEDVGRTIARKLFLEVEKPEFDKAQVAALGKSVVNRVNSLKATFRAEKKALSSTGHRIVTGPEGPEGLTPGSDLDDLWGDLIKKFPWYLEMNQLMGSSSAVDETAVSNSSTTFNLAITTPAATQPGTNAGEDSNVSDLGDSSSEVDGSDSDPSDADGSVCGSSAPPVLQSPSRSKRKRSAPQSATPAPPAKRMASFHSPSPATTSRYQKHSMYSFASEFSEKEASSRRDLVQIKERERRKAKEAKLKTNYELELAKLKFQAEENEKHRQHEFRMAQLARNGALPPAAGPSTYGHPAIDLSLL